LTVRDKDYETFQPEKCIYLHNFKFNAFENFKTSFVIILKEEIKTKTSCKLCYFHWTNIFLWKKITSKPS